MLRGFMMAAGFMLLTAAAMPASGVPAAFGHRTVGSTFDGAPENTVAGVHRGAALGATHFEVDAALTSDGHVILMHDPTVDRTTNGTGAVGLFTFNQIRQLDAGSWFHPSYAGEKVPTLSEVVLAAQSHGGRVLVDRKDPVTQLAPAISAQFAANNVPTEAVWFVVSSMADATVYRNYFPDAEFALLTNLPDDPAQFDFAGWQALNLTMVWFNFNRLTEPWVEAVQAHGMEAFTFVATASQTQWTQAINAGVDYIDTNSIAQYLTFGNNFITGDVNGDRAVNIGDFNALYANIAAPNATTRFRYDLYYDNELNELDVIDLAEAAGTRQGDVNLDRRVNIADLSLLATHFGQSGGGWGAGDVNGDGVTNITDLSLLATWFGFDGTGGGMGLAAGGGGAAVPEPLTATLMLIAAGSVIRRRRRGSSFSAV